MAETPARHEEAAHLTARLRDDLNDIDPVTAADVGISLLGALDDDTDPETLRLVTGLVGFALRVAPDHPSVPEWWAELGFAHGWIAEKTDSASAYDTALACLLTAVTSPQAPPDVAEQAAVDLARLTGSRLLLEGVTVGRARQLIRTLDGVSLSWTDAMNATNFECGLAWSLRCSYLLTEDIAQLQRAADVLRRALAAPVLTRAGEDCAGEWELLATILEGLYLDGGDLGLLNEALTAAVTACESLPEDHERLPEAHGLVAEIAVELFWKSDREASAVLDTAINSLAAKRAAIGLDDNETVSYALLLQVRGCDAEDVPALIAAVEVLETPEWSPGAEAMLAALHEQLTHFVDRRHAWQTIDWATRALSRTDLGSDVVLPLHVSRIAGLMVALEVFGGNEVAARCDVDAILAGAKAQASAGEDVAHAELGYQVARLSCGWSADRFPLDMDLFQTTSVEMANALTRMRDHADEDHKPKLAAVATLFENMVPVVMGDRDPGLLRNALRDENLRDVVDVDGMLRWLDHGIELKEMLDGRRPAGAPFQELIAKIVTDMTESERDGVNAIVPVLSALAESAGALVNGDSAERSAAYWKIIRMCDELPGNMASSPLVRRIRGVVAAQLVVGGHDSDQAGPAIDDLERALDLPNGRWPEDGTDITERLGHLLRQRGGPGDAERSRQLGLRALVQQTWRVLTRPGQSHHDTSTPRFARMVGDWCREDGALDDLVRVVEAERGVALARGVGVELLHGHLVDSGRVDLAEEWVAAHRTDDAWAVQHLDPLAQLSEKDRQALVEPFGPDQIRPLLRDLGLDVLVYLVPGHPGLGGVAVVVPADGAVTSAELPLLTGEYFTGNPTAEPAALDALGGWAWLVGGAAVLAAARPAGPGRVPRVALVPVGTLGSVPWAAAWRETENGRRYLVEDVEITIVVSARLLARSVRAVEEPVLLRSGRMPGADYDEALEPSSTFLVRGSRTVVRGVWPTEDNPVLFALFRHYLGEHPTSPAAALREAQLWMLDPHRVLPSGMSACELENPAEIGNWGGFAHLGA